MSHYVLKDTETGKYFPSGQMCFPFVESIDDARVFAKRTSALYAKNGDMPEVKRREADPNNEIPDIDNLEPQPVKVHAS